MHLLTALLALQTFNLQYLNGTTGSFSGQATNFFQTLVPNGGVASAGIILTVLSLVKESEMKTCTSLFYTRSLCQAETILSSQLPAFQYFSNEGSQ